MGNRQFWIAACARKQARAVYAVFALATCAASAHADVARNRCTAPGQACTDELSQQAGVCVEDKCTRSRPLPDGGILKNEYDCFNCVNNGKASSGGAGGAGGSKTESGGSGGSGSKAGSGASKAAADSSSDSGCATIAGPGELSSLLLVGVGLACRWLKRRRARS